MRIWKIKFRLSEDVTPLVSQGSRVLLRKFRVEIGWGAMWGLYWHLFWSRISIKAQQRNFRNLNVEITKSTIWKKTEAATLRPHRHSTHLGTTHSPCTFRAQSPENSARIAMKAGPLSPSHTAQRKKLKVEQLRIMSKT